MTKRKMSENSLKNLELANPANNFNNSEVARKAQAKSVEKRKENQTLAQLLRIALLLPNEETGETNNIAITNAIINKAAKGDVTAYQTIRDTIGEKPKQDINLNGGVEIQKVFITEEEIKRTDKYIDNVIKRG